MSLLASAGIAAVAATVPTHDLAGTLPGPTIAADTIATAGVPPGEWHAYGRTPHGRRYSPLDQITPANVSSLVDAWHYHTGDVRGPEDPGETTYEVTPLMVGDTLYLCTPHQFVIALDAETGAEKWRFDPKIKEPQANNTQHLTCRGVSYHDGTAPTRRSRHAGLRPAAVHADRRCPPHRAQRRDRRHLPGLRRRGRHGRPLAEHAQCAAGSYYSTSPPVVTQRSHHRRRRGQ